MATASTSEVVRAFAMRAPFRDALLTLAAAGPSPASGKSAACRHSTRPTAALPAIAASRCAKRRRRCRCGRRMRLADVACRPRFASRAGPRDQDSAQRDHRFRRDHRGPVSGPGGPRLSRARERDRAPGAAAADRHRRSRFRREGSFRSAAHASGVRPWRTGRARGGGAARTRRAKGASNSTLRASGSQVPARVEPELADRLLFRLFGALVELAESGERLQLSVDLASDGARISISRPAALRGNVGRRAVRQAIGPVRAASRCGWCAASRGLPAAISSSSRDTFALVFPRG